MPFLRPSLTSKRFKVEIFYVNIHSISRRVEKRKSFLIKSLAERKPTINKVRRSVGSFAVSDFLDETF